MSAAARILLVEDDPNLGFVTQDSLRHRGYDVTLCTDGAAALQCFETAPFDLCLLDVMMPRLDGFALAARLRARDPHVPILFLTAKSLLEDRLTGLRLGADDYLTKPFSLEELLLRIRVFLRRAGHAPVPAVRGVYRLGEATFDFPNLRLQTPAGEHRLTLREAELLRLFCQRSDGPVLRRADILQEVWGDDDYFTGRSLDVFISRLRKYLRPCPEVRIENVHGVGFRMVAG